MKKIFVCSRLRGKTPEEYKKNIEIAESLCRIVSMLGHLPIAPHVYFPNFLSDDNESERKLGIDMGIELLRECDEIWVFDFNDISAGMETEIDYALKCDIKIRYFCGLDFPLSKPPIMAIDDTLPLRGTRYQPFDYNDYPSGGEF